MFVGTTGQNTEIMNGSIKKNRTHGYRTPQGTAVYDSGEPQRHNGHLDEHCSYTYTGLVGKNDTPVDRWFSTFVAFIDENRTLRHPGIKHLTVCCRY